MSHLYVAVLKAGGHPIVDLIDEVVAGDRDNQKGNRNLKCSNEPECDQEPGTEIEGFHHIALVTPGPNAVRHAWTRIV